MNEANTISEQALENKCPSCTASIKFNPTIGKFKCEYCGSEFTLEELKKYSNNAATDANNASNPQQQATIEQSIPADNYSNYISYKCESCGAEIVTDEQTAATFCVYCGNTAILKSKLSGQFTPNKIIPFAKDKASAVEAFKSLKKGRPLMPKDFCNEQNIEKIRGVYIPFWLYDIFVSGDVEMHGEIITHWSRGDTRYTKTDIYKVIRGGTMAYKGIPVDGSSRFDNNIMNSIEPFDYSAFLPYNHAYLSGFLAEKYDEEGDANFEEAKKRALNSTRNFMQADATMYTAKAIEKDTLLPQQTNREYAMLPVWMVNVKYKNKPYIFAMNGQTGKFIGNIPLDVTKTILFAIIIFIIVVIVGSIISYVSFHL